MENLKMGASLALGAKDVPFREELQKSLCAPSRRAKIRCTIPKSHSKNTVCAPRDWPAPKALANVSGYREYFGMAFGDGTLYFGSVAWGRK